MITLIRIIMIRIIAGTKLQIALNIDGEIRLNSKVGPMYIGPGIKETRR